ncbi:peptidoglycan editing factor PgeF [bacterium]|nr:peptidoglycan editing factor PgeF [bacterium]
MVNVLEVEEKMETEKISWREREGIKYLVFPRFEETDLVIHAFTSRPLDLRFGRRPREGILRDRRQVCHILGVNFLCLTAGEQVHRAEVSTVGREDEGRGALTQEGAIPEVDGSVSDVSEVPLVLFTADCVPLFFLDPVKRAIGLAHAGWRGTLARAAGKVVSQMEEVYGTRPEDLLVILGPSIGPCCYEVGEEIINLFHHRFSDGRRLNLWEANREELLSEGVKDENIVNVGICTSCHNDIFFSERRDGSPTGRMMALLMLSSN